MCTPRHTAESFHAIYWHWHAKLAHAQVWGRPRREALPTLAAESMQTRFRHCAMWPMGVVCFASSGRQKHHRTNPCIPMPETNLHFNTALRRLHCIFLPRFVLEVFRMRVFWFSRYSGLALLLATLPWASQAQTATRPLNDTGITWSGHATSSNARILVIF